MGKLSAIGRLLIVGALGLAPVAAAQQTPQPTQAPLDYVASLIPIGMRSIPSESMLPNLIVGDRVVIVANTPEPMRGQVVIFQHPHSDRVMVKRIIGLPGDRIQMKDGQLFLNGEAVTRTLVREVTYLSDGPNRPLNAIEYSEQLPGEETPHLIHEFSDRDSLDQTPEFLVPAGHLFMMGDNRDNAEDSRAPTGHRALATANPEAWPKGVVYLPTHTSDDAIGFVPIRNLMGRAATVVFSFNMCRLTDAQRADGVECLKSKTAQPL